MTTQPLPRVCHLQKAFAEQEYGFNLHAEAGRGQYIGSVDFDSPAAKAGLLQGDRIVGVNGASVSQLSHRDVVARIKDNPDSCSLTVIDEIGEQWYRDRKMSIPLDASQPNAIRMSVDEDGLKELTHESPKPLPRLSKLVKESADQEYGFNLHAERNRGHFIGQVDAGSIARQAMLEEGQRIVGVNGTLIYMSTPHKDVVRLIKDDPMQVELLVASPQVDEWYRTNSVEYSFTNVESARTAAQGTHTILPAPIHENPVFTACSLRYDEERIENDQMMTHKREITKIAVNAEPTKETKRTTKLENASNGSASDAPCFSADKNGTAWTKLTAAEMRQYLQRNKRDDPRNQPLSMEKKYQIAQNL